MNSGAWDLSDNLEEYNDMRLRMEGRRQIMFEWVGEIAGCFGNTRGNKGVAAKKENNKKDEKSFDKEGKVAVLKCSICNGEQVAGWKDIRTGKFEEVSFIRSEKELKDFMKSYGIIEITKEY